MTTHYQLKIVFKKPHDTLVSSFEVPKLQLAYLLQLSLLDDYGQNSRGQQLCMLLLLDGLFLSQGMKLSLAKNLHVLRDGLCFSDYQELSFLKKVKYLRQAYLLVTFLNCYQFVEL